LDAEGAVGVTIRKGNEQEMARREGEDFFWQGGADLSKLSEELGHMRPRIAAKKNWEPLVDLVEETDRLVLKAEIAGVTSEGIEVTYIAERHSILIIGERVEDEGSEQNRIGVYQLEILYGAFEREVPLPKIGLSLDEMRALYKNGLLIVLIPKSDLTSKQVVIQTD
jgi:HSP20 family molecular chaperone IbpA